MRGFWRIVSYVVIGLVLWLLVFTWGAMSVLHSDGFYDAETNEFCVIWADHVWAWHMDEK